MPPPAALAGYDYDCDWAGERQIFQNSKRKAACAGGAAEQKYSSHWMGKYGNNDCGGVAKREPVGCSQGRLTSKKPNGKHTCACG